MKLYILIYLVYINKEILNDQYFNLKDKNKINLIDKI